MCYRPALEEVHVATARSPVKTKSSLSHCENALARCNKPAY